MAGGGPRRLPRRPASRGWQGAFIIGLFFCAVVGAAAVGWWYARESPPHQGPIIVISADRFAAASLPVYGAPGTDTPAIDALAGDSVVFDRAYAHSPLLLPAHASLLSGQLPIDHGVRDDAGFALHDETRTLAELLRNRGFTTGAAVSSFLLRRDSGVAQGFGFFDASLPEPSGPPMALSDRPPGQTAEVERGGALTLAAAETWLRARDGQRFFLFVQVEHADADAVVGRLVEVLKERDLYAPATIVFVGSRGDVGSGMTLDEAALRIPLLVKQPDAAGAGRRVAGAVQHVDLVPTLLDLVRAPIPGSLRGRSLRGILDDEDAEVTPRPIYAEALTAHYRFGGRPLFAVADEQFRFIRGVSEELLPLAPAPDEAGASVETVRLRAELDRLLASAPAPLGDASVPIAPSDEERFALSGYLASVRLTPAGDLPLTIDQQKTLVESHRAAAILVGQKKYSSAIRALQAMASQHPALTTIHYQLAMLLARTGRLEEAIEAFRTARQLRPDAPAVALALAEAEMRAGRLQSAQATVADAILLADSNAADARGRAVAHAVAARIALARKDAGSATSHAEAAHAADPLVPMPQFVKGRVLYDAGQYDEALAALRQADAALRERGGTLADLHLYLGETLAHLEQYVDAETQFREELIAFPRNTQAYASLAMLYRASNRDDAVEDVLNELVAATPTPEGYALAARLWIVLGDRSRAEALRSDARTRFRGDPSLELIGRDGRR